MTPFAFSLVSASLSLCFSVCNQVGFFPEKERKQPKQEEALFSPVAIPR